MNITYIGFGSNLGDSVAIFNTAIEHLKAHGQVRVSQLYSSPPMGPQDQPDYFNAVVELITSLSPLALLDQLQALEIEAGRVRLRHWGERTLDLDLLLYADQVIHHERLIVPHVGVLLRDFVLLPLLDLNPNLIVHGHQLAMLDVVKSSTLKPVLAADWAVHAPASST